MCEVTSTKRWRWVVSGLVWLVRERSVGGTKKGGMNSTAPARIGRSAVIKTGVALCAPKKRNTWANVFAANSSLELHENEDPVEGLSQRRAMR